MPDSMLLVAEAPFLEEARKDTSFTPALVSTSQPASVQAELECILSSPFFRSSPRSQEFLRHIVRFADVPSELKERTIGVAVFGRAVDYDTGADAIVRVKAVDLRKRLTQYNSTADPERSVRIELQAGSYLPRISYLENPESDAVSERLAPPAAEQAAPAFASASEPTLLAAPTLVRKVRLAIPWKAWVAVAAVLLASVAVASYVRANSPARRFLRPLLASAGQPIICLSHPNAYNLSLETVKKKGDAPMAFRLREMLVHAGRTPRLSVAADLTADDLKASPVILLGGPHHNPWTAALTQNLRFSFQMADKTPRIIDRDSPTRFWEDADQNDMRSDDDYVIITRLLATARTQPVLCIAGLRAQGTISGAQIVFDEAALRQVLRYAPDDWEQKNLQLVLHVKYRGEAMPVFDLRAATYW
ncbi:MAG TPA: hypothetical protein VGN16_22730 [Acidobacteriaceae bacterium]|jgi:hypothetical protein